MGRLLYNVYSNISDRKYLEVEKKMSIWEHYMFRVLLPLGWRCTKKVIENDALIVDFTKDDKTFRGNMGIVYEDKPGKITFNFYLTKSFDESGFRYFFALDIFSGREAESFENDIVELTKSTLEKYSTITKSDVIDLGEKDAIG
jgi:hypothetical protein